MRERDRVQNQEAMVRGRRASAEGTAVNQEVVQQEQIQEQTAVLQKSSNHFRRITSSLSVRTILTSACSHTILY